MTMKGSQLLLILLICQTLIFACASDADDSPGDQDTNKNKNITEEEDKSDEKEDEKKNDGLIVLESFPLCDDLKQPTPSLLSNRDDANSGKCGIFIEENGLVIFEAENTQSDYNSADNDWVFSNADTEVSADGGFVNTKMINDHRGSGYLWYNGNFWNKDAYKPSPLVYKFKVQNTGSYRMLVRSIKAVDKVGKRGDTFNDCFVRMEGNFQNGQINEKCIDLGGKDVLLPSDYHLRKDTKYFGASNEEWKSSGVFDAHLDYKPWAVYTFKAGETYTLIVSGRSRNYHIDRWILFDLHKYTWGEMNNYLKNGAQSACMAE